MAERFKEYLEMKKFELNVDKTKMIRFRKGGGREDRRMWRWKGKVKK